MVDRQMSFLSYTKQIIRSRMPVRGIFNFYTRTADKYDRGAKRKRVRSTRDLYLRWFRTDPRDQGLRPARMILICKPLSLSPYLSVVHANVRTLGPRFRRTTCEMRVADRSNSIVGELVDYTVKWRFPVSAVLVLFAHFLLLCLSQNNVFSFRRFR